MTDYYIQAYCFSAQMSQLKNAPPQVKSLCVKVSVDGVFGNTTRRSRKTSSSRIPEHFGGSIHTCPCINKLKINAITSNISDTICLQLKQLTDGVVVPK
jgi:hypothetical protein